MTFLMFSGECNKKCKSLFLIWATQTSWGSGYTHLLAHYSKKGNRSIPKHSTPIGGEMEEVDLVWRLQETDYGD